MERRAKEDDGDELAMVAAMAELLPDGIRPSDSPSTLTK
jgi:hypothetical protein